MQHPPRQSTPKITVNGQAASVSKGPGGAMNININMGGHKAMGPVHLASDGKVTKQGVTARTEQDMQMSMGAGSSANFSNPKENVRRAGFKEGMRIADFGSGSGSYTLALSELVGSSGRVYAVDVQRDLLTRIQNEASQKSLNNIEVVWSDIENVDGVSIRDGLLDGVIISNTLFQTENKHNVIKEAWRVLKPSGMLVIIDWTDSHGGLGPRQNDVVTQAEATLVCTDNGFAFKSEFSAGEHHYGLVFIKVVEGQDESEVVSQAQQADTDFIQRTIAQELI